MANRAYHRKYSRKYYHLRRNEYIQMLGGKCCKCGAADNLQFDHIKRATKKFALGKLLNVSKEMALIEIKKCQLLCFECHIIKSRAEISRLFKYRNAIKRRVASMVDTRS